MAWYLRKSFGFGPFRINLSKSGLGYSFGVKGARIGTGPRGSYVHMGRHGIYYRQSLSSSSGAPGTIPPAASRNDNFIPTDEAMGLTDTSADGLLAEIREKHARATFLVPTFIGLSLVLFAMLALQAPLWADGLAIACILGSLYLRKVDKKRKTVSLRYHLEEDALKRYGTLLSAFETLSRTHRIWRVTSQGRADAKYNAGAGTTVTRVSATVSPNAPAFLETNVAVWRLGLSDQDLYFLPERILVYQGSQVGAVSYSDLQVTFGETRFVEDSAPPTDAKTVGQTWKYVNRDGGPDRRFSSNPVLPIALYGDIELRSATGMRFVLQVSNLEYGRQFA